MPLLPRNVVPPERPEAACRREGRASPPTGSIALTEAMIRQLVSEGWAAEELREAAAQGARYDPLCEGLVYPDLDTEAEEDGA
jgi:hypothetical protein